MAFGEGMGGGLIRCWWVGSQYASSIFPPEFYHNSWDKSIES